MEEFPYYPYTIPVTPRDYSEIRGQAYPLYEWRHQETATWDVWVPPGRPLMTVLINPQYDDDPMKKYQKRLEIEIRINELMQHIEEPNTDEDPFILALYKIWKGLDDRTPVETNPKVLDVYTHIAVVFALKTAIRKEEATYLYSVSDQQSRNLFLIALLYYHSHVTEQDLKDIGYSDSEIFDVLISNPLDDRYQSILDRLLPTFLSKVDTVWKYKNVSRRVRPEEVVQYIDNSEIMRFWEMMSPSEQSKAGPKLTSLQKIILDWEKK